MIKLNPTVTCYDGYCSPQRLYVKGRVMKTPYLRRSSNRSAGGNFIETALRFVTIEYEYVGVSLTVGDQVYRTQTDHEGYYVFDQENVASLSITEDLQWIELEVSVDHIDFEGVSTTTKVLYVPDHTDIVVISDIDDTIMWSYVTSYLKIKMMYFTFTRSPFQRTPVAGMSNCIQSILQSKRPVFYISNSPWNIYYFLKRFIKHYGYVDGPTFLRDYGRQLIFRNKSNITHKLNMLHKVISTFSTQKFVLIGDSAESDIDYYLEMYRVYGDRIEQILIHDVGHRKNRKRIIQLIADHPDVDIQLNSVVKKFVISDTISTNKK